jgi:hypothetical protein
MNRGTVAEVMAFARADGVRQYDEIATRMAAASPFVGLAPLCTLAHETRHLPPPELLERERLKGLRSAARPLSFDLELDGRLAYEFTDDQIRLRLHDQGRVRMRRVSRGHPPSFFLEVSKPDPAPPLLGQQLQPDEAPTEIWWLPFLALVEQGRFVRMQQCDRLTRRLESTAFYLFVSHRWLDLANPDPDGGQAAAVAWQMVAETVEAIWVRAARGAEARLLSRAGHLHVGPSGSDLAESIVVNLLASLAEPAFAALVREAESFDDIEVDRGVREARGDVGLARLRARLAATPALRDLLSHIRLWYDFNCMPQEPRTPEEQARFESMLPRQAAVQAMGRTAVLLDDLGDYFGRGWCSYESTLARSYLAGSVDVWAGSRGTLFQSSAAIAAFMRVLNDRPYLLWRAILDTELFALQTPEDCMARLGLETTRPEDRRLVYGLLRALGVPPSIHFDDGEVVSGVFPLPVVDGRAAVVRQSARKVDALRTPEVRDFTIAFPRITWPSLGPAGLPSWHEFHSLADQRRDDRRRTAHVAVIGTCEGEAMLFAHGVLEHRQTLEAALQVRIVSLSWVASDVAPVGHFATEALSVRPVPCDSWILVATHASLVAGVTTALLIETLWCARIDHAELEVDMREHQLKLYAKGDVSTESDDGARLLRFDLDDPKLARIERPLFRPELMESLGIQRSLREQP